MRPLAALAVQWVPALDAIILAASLAFTWKLRPAAPLTDLILTFLAVPFWVYFLRYFGFYESHRVDGIRATIRALVASQIVGIGSFWLAVWLTGIGDRGLDLAAFAAASTIALFIPRLLFYAIVPVLRRSGFDHRNVCVIGTRETADEIAARFAQHPTWGLRVTCVGVPEDSARRYYTYPSGHLLGNSLEEALHSNVVDEVLIAVGPDELPSETATIRVFERNGLVGRVLLRSGGVETECTRVEPFCGELALTIGRLRPDGSAMLVKQVLDVVLSAALLVALSPLLVVVAMLVKLSSPGPVFFRQTRVGLNGRRFTMYKFRTMVDGAEKLLPSFAHRNIMSGPIFKDPNDIRVTPIGRTLRRFSLDELSQLVNVLKGDMSLVGPRPLPVHEATAIFDTHRKRFCMKPGITCLWQVNGRNDVKFAAWMNYDLEYVDNWSLWLDAKLLLKTIPAILSGRGAY